MLGERDRNRRRIVGLLLRAHAQRLQPLEQHPRVERRQRRSGLADQLVDVVGDEFLRAEDDTAETAALAVDVLGRRIDDAVGAELQRALVERGGEHVVHHQRRAGRMRDVGDRLDVEHFQIGIGWALQEAGLGVLLHRLLPLAEVGAVDQCRSDAVARQMFLDDVAAGAEQLLRGDDMVAGAQLPHQCGVDRGHAGGGGAGGFRALERCHALLEHVDRGIGKPRILVARLLVLEPPLGLQRIVIDIALGEEQRLRSLAELRAQDAGMHQAGFRAVAFGRGRSHLGSPSRTKNPAGMFSAGSTRPRPFSTFV